jgi:hypothetical protein
MKRIQTAALQNNEGHYENNSIIQDKRPHFLTRLLSGWLQFWRNRPRSLPPSASPQDPFVGSPSRLPPKPKRSGGAVAVAEPDDE